MGLRELVILTSDQSCFDAVSAPNHVFTRSQMSLLFPSGWIVRKGADICVYILDVDPQNALYVHMYIGLFPFLQNQTNLHPVKMNPTD